MFAQIGSEGFEPPSLPDVGSDLLLIYDPIQKEQNGVSDLSGS